MALNYENLDASTRSFMLSEVDLDLSHDKLYMSPRLNELGAQNYVSLLKEAIEHHDDAWLAEQLRNRGYMKENEQRKNQDGGFTTVRVPKTAPDTLSEGEFNRYYARGLCVRAIDEGIDQVEVYRGKPVSPSRPESEALLGKRVSAEALLNDLRESIGVEPALGLPPGPNSGLTVRMEKLEGITKISVSGFKSIAAECEIDIRPLTILAGANSSGKSSIMQPLLMLKQTLDPSHDPKSLRIDGPNVKFTLASQFLSKLTGEERAEHFQIRIETRADDFSHAVTTIFRTAGKEVELVETATERKLEADPLLSPKYIILHPDMSPEAIKLFVDQDPLLGIQGVDRVIRSRCFLGFGSPEGYTSFDHTANLESNILNTIHLPGLRGNPERTYELTSTGPQYRGTFEHYVASVIDEWQETRDERLNTLVDALYTLGLTGQVGTKKIGDARIELQVGRLPHDRTSETDMVNIADVGFGVSQVLPVLVALIGAEPGQLVYIEQPELHLHPRAQVALANVLADAAKRGVRVVAETHSSLLLLGVQTLVVEGSLSPDLVKLHWFTRGGNGVTQVSSADLDKMGAYGDWPVDFGDVNLVAQSRYLDAADSVGFSNMEVS